MREIGSREYALRVGDQIESDIEVRLLITFNAIARDYGFEPIRAGESEDMFENAYWESGCAAKMRDLAIELFE